MTASCTSTEGAPLSESTQGRLPLLDPANLDPAQREVYDAIASGPRAGGPFSVVDGAGRLLGPFNALLHQPTIGAAVERLGSALRFSGALHARTRELVICAVAARWDSEYEWYAHSRMAREVGISEDELTEVAAGRLPTGLTDGESAALRLATGLLHDHAVSAEVYADVVAHHGEPGLVELCAVVGYYQLLAGLLAAADVGAPDQTPGATVREVGS
jgi:4-carboxymuconolactone decarboxylase